MVRKIACNVIVSVIFSILVFGTGIVYADEDQEWQDFMLEGDYYCDNGEVMTFYDDYTAYYSGFDDCEVTWDWGEYAWTAEVYFYFDDGRQNILYLDINKSNDGVYSLSSEKDGFFMTQQVNYDYNFTVNIEDDIHNDLVANIDSVGEVGDGLFWMSYTNKNGENVKAVVDTNGKVLFWTDAYITNMTQFGNGYTYFEYSNNVYRMETNGNVIKLGPIAPNAIILGQKNHFSGVKAYGDGYVLYQEYEGDFDASGFKYRLEDSMGNELMSYMENGETPVYAIYLGNGVFCFSRYGSEKTVNLYCVKSQKWTDNLSIFQDYINDFMRLGHFIEGIMVLNCEYEYNDGVKSYSFSFVNDLGDVNRVTIPNDYVSISEYETEEPYIVGVSNGKILFANKKLLNNRTYGDVLNDFGMPYYLYDINSGEFIPYKIGRYSEHLTFNNSIDIGGGMICVPLMGSDSYSYVGVLDESFTEIEEPILAGGSYIKDDMLVISDSSKSYIGDYYKFDNGKLNLMGSNAFHISCGCIFKSNNNNNDLSIYDYYGNMLSDQLDFDSSKYFDLDEIGY